MNFTKIKTAIYLAFTVAALSACGDSKKAENDKAAEKPVAETTAETPAVAATPNANAQTIVIGTEANFLPLRYRDGQNPQPSGFQIDVLAAAAKAAGLNITYEFSPNAPKLDKLNSEKYIATLATFDNTPENQAIADFTKPITTTKYMVHLKANAMGSGSLNELQGKTISIDKYYAANPAIMEFLEKATGSKKNIVVEGYLFPAWKNMVSGKTDGVFGEDLILDHTYNTNKDKMDLKIKAVDLGMPANERALLMRKGNSELLHKINTGIDKIKADGTYDSLKAKWFPELK